MHNFLSLPRKIILYIYKYKLYIHFLKAIDITSVVVLTYIIGIFMKYCPCDCKTDLKNE